MNLLTTNLERVGLALNQAATGISTLVTLCGLGFAGFAITPTVTLVAISWGILVLVAYRGLRRRATGLGVRLGEAYRAVHADLSESLETLRTVKILGSEQRAEALAFLGFSELGNARLSYQRDLGVGHS